MVNCGSASASRAWRSPSSKVALRSTGTTPVRSAPSTAQINPAEEGRQKATRWPATSPEAASAPAARRCASSACLGGEHLHVRRVVQGTSGVGTTVDAGSVRAGSPSTEKNPGRSTAMAVSDGEEHHRPGHGDRPHTDAVGDPPLKHGPDRIDDAQTHHVDAQDPSPGLGRGPKLDGRVEPGQYGDVAGADRDEGH